MHTVVIVVLVALGLAVLIGAVVAFFAFRKAPNGFEDETGYHPGDEQKRR